MFEIFVGDFQRSSLEFLGWFSVKNLYLSIATIQLNCPISENKLPKVGRSYEVHSFFCVPLGVGRYSVSIKTINRCLRVKHRTNCFRNSVLQWFVKYNEQLPKAALNCSLYAQFGDVNNAFTTSPHSWSEKDACDDCLMFTIG